MAMRMLAGAAIALVATATTAQQPRARAPDLPATARQVAERTNQFRADQGLTKLRMNPALARAAQSFAEFMADTDQYGHDADGRRPAERAAAHGYEYCMVAENIAYQFSSLGFATTELAQRLQEGWEQSPSHRKNMLRPNVTDIGVAVAVSARTHRFYGVQLFGRPKSESTRFEMANRAGSDVRYELEGETFSLPPRVTRTHQGCFDGAVNVLWPNGSAGPGFQPRDGGRYTVVQDEAGQLRLHGQ